jgi:glyoxylase-like metal-dependent hydrolase (beta-lactamase superfamily II)
LTDQEPAPDFSIWSFCFAKGQVPRDFIEGSPVGSNQGLLQIPMVYSAVVPARSSARPHVFLVDTGFASGRSMTGRQFADFETPAEILSKVELEPEDVKAILLTHLHFDHAGNIGAFKHATILLQRCEYEGWKRALKVLPDQPADKRSWILSSMNLDDMAELDRAVADGRATLIEGAHEVCPGIRLHLAADSHTFGSQWVEIRTPEDRYVMAGDVIASFANVERMWPPGYHQGNCWNLLAAYRDIQSVVGQSQWQRIVPGHDMELFRRMPSWNAARNPVAEVHLAAGQRSYVEGA